MRHSATLVCVAALLACDRGADRITAPGPSHDILPLVTEFLPGIPVLDPFAPDPEGDNGVIASARGGGHFHIGDDLRTFAFTAKTKGDGTTQGQFQLYNRATGGKEHGMVTCLEVDGHQAWIGAIITNSNIGTEGTTRIWRVIDNGEGSNFPPDEISLAFSGGFPPGDQGCHLRTEFPLNNIEEGNIQVSGATGGEPV
jgi:hypothetical protein